MLYIYILYHISRLHQPLHDLADDAQLLVVFDVKLRIFRSATLGVADRNLDQCLLARCFRVAFLRPCLVKKALLACEGKKPLEAKMYAPFPEPGENPLTKRGGGRYVATNMRMLQTHPFGTCADFLMGT